MSVSSGLPKLLPLIVLLLLILQSCSSREPFHCYVLRQKLPPGSELSMQNGEPADNRAPVLRHEIDRLNKDISKSIQDQRLHDAKALYPELIKALIKSGDRDEVDLARSGEQSLDYLIAHPEMSPSKPASPDLRLFKILDQQNKEKEGLAEPEPRENRSMELEKFTLTPGVWPVHFNPPFMVSYMRGLEESRFSLNILWADAGSCFGRAYWACGAGPTDAGVSAEAEFTGKIQANRVHFELKDLRHKNVLMELDGRLSESGTQITGEVHGSGGGEGLERIPSTGGFSMQALPEAADKTVEILNAPSEELADFYHGRWTLMQRGNIIASGIDSASFFPVSKEDVFLEKDPLSGWVLRSAACTYQLKVKNEAKTAILNFGYLNGNLIVFECWKLQPHGSDFEGTRSVSIIDPERKTRTKLEFKLRACPCVVPISSS